MNKIKIWLKCGIIEVLRLTLFIGVIVFSAGLGMISYKIYELNFESDYVLEAISYLFTCMGYLVGVYFLDKFLINRLMIIKAKLKTY